MARNVGFLRGRLSISDRLTTIHFSKKRFMAWKEKTNKQERFYKRWVSPASDLPTPDKGKSGDHEKKNMEILQKVVRSWFFPIKIKRTLFFFSLGKLTVTSFKKLNLKTRETHSRIIRVGRSIAWILHKKWGGD